MAATRLAVTPPSLADVATALRHLRRPWPEAWPGLPVVLQSAWQQLSLGTPRSGSRAHALRLFARSVCAHVESDGAHKHAQGLEPAYHNRLHIADTLVCMTYLLQACAHAQVPGVQAVSALALATMAGHDFLHPGGANRVPAELETRAVQDLQPWMVQAGLHADDRENLVHCILSSDPLRVKACHLEVRTRPFDLRRRECLAVLVQEADILASTLPQTQQGLTQALSREWTPSQPHAAGQLLLPQNRLLFLEHAALFSSPAAQLWGLDRVKERQVSRIKKQLAAGG